MKKAMFSITVLVVLCSTLLAFSTPLLAAPYLVCDPYPDTSKPTYFKVVVDAKPAVNVNYALHSSGAAIVFDLAGLDAVSHSLTVSACNERGCSSTVPFVVPSIPTTPSKTRLAP